MSTMGIGVLTLSLSQDKTDAKDNLSAKTTMSSLSLEETVVEGQENPDQFATTVASDPTVTPIPTVAPTPTPLPVYSIEEKGYPKISQLVKDYYVAKSNRDIETLKNLLSDPNKADTQEELQLKTEYIDEYRNVNVYVKKSYQEGTYIVYAYHEIKFTSINTPAPSLSKFYIVTASDSTLKIFSEEMDEQTRVYYDERSNDADILELMEMTNQKSKEAMEKDEDLKNFWNNVAEIANSKQDKTKAEGDTN